MKFNFKDIEVTFSKYALIFKRAKVNQYQQFINEFSPIEKEAVKDDVIDTKKLNKEQLAFLMDSEVRYLAYMLKSATYEDGEVVEDKEMFISFLLDESSDFKEWASGFLNGEKKT